METPGAVRHAWSREGSRQHVCQAAGQAAWAETGGDDSARSSGSCSSQALGGAAAGPLL